MKTIVLYSYYTNKMSYYDDWVDAFRKHPVYEAICINVFKSYDKAFQQNVAREIKKAELVVLHHSMTADTLNYLKPFVTPLKQRKGKLVSFVGNEVNLPTLGMAQKIKILQDLEADIIATQLLLEAGKWLYKSCVKSRVISLPHALNPDKFKNGIENGKRPIHIGTRSARYGVYIGDNDRNEIIRYFNNNPHGLVLDLGLKKSDQKRFNRDEWGRFLGRCKATLSTEAGSFYLEPDDKLVQKIHHFLKARSSKFVLSNDTLLRRIYRVCIPSIIRKKIVHLLKDKIVETDQVDSDILFQEIYDQFFVNTQKAPVYTKAISSRHFDAIGTHTMHVMYPGRYNDILKPHVHYFELKKDHSNVDELRDFLSHPTKIKELTHRAYEHVIAQHTHHHRLDMLITHL